MKIAEITLQNFRCFGQEPTTVHLNKLTAFVGANGTGKTAVLHALLRLFGVTGADRRLERLDFHVPANIDPAAQTSQSLVIEARLEFPELRDPKAPPSTAVADCFAHMVVDAEAAVPYCRVRLEATWTRSNLPEGDIDEKLYWITSPDAEVGDKDKRPFQPHARNCIHAIYVPATRDPSEQLRALSSGTLMSLLRAVEWSETARKSIEEASQTIKDTFAKTDAIARIHKGLDCHWADLYDGRWYDKPRLQPVGSTLEELFRRVSFSFSQPETANNIELQRLSDGLRSLFYLALVAAAFDVAQSAVAKDDEGNLAASGFSPDKLSPPNLTVFAVEEPENHLAPHYLARILTLFEHIAQQPSGQVLLSSHSAPILKRIDPRRVRHFRLLIPSQTCRVMPIVLPPAVDAVFKYVREAVQAYPELYFSRFVILCEGDSEEVILPRVARTRKLPIDSGFISVVPLGGRHVNHFWKLLRGLDIPHITLLDFDRERDGGAWGRIKYALTQLLENGVSAETLLQFKHEGKTCTLAQTALRAMHERPLDHPALTFWLNRLEAHGVFFSAPLDVDFLMLTHYAAAYTQLEDGDHGPRVPDPAKKKQGYDKRIADAVRVTLGDAGGDGSSYSADEKGLFPWYTYLFLGKGKPSTHVLSLARLTDEDIATAIPPVFQRMFDHIEAQIKPPVSWDDLW